MKYIINVDIIVEANSTEEAYFSLQNILSNIRDSNLIDSYCLGDIDESIEID